MPYPPMTQGTLRAKMRRYLAPFNDERLAITDDTRHDAILSESDGKSRATSSKTVYHGMVRWKLQQHGQDTARWPSDWMSHTVAELASILIP